jgi:hypothetical protein
LRLLGQDQPPAAKATRPAGFVHVDCIDPPPRWQSGNPSAILVAAGRDLRRRECVDSCLSARVNSVGPEPLDVNGGDGCSGRGWDVAVHPEEVSGVILSLDALETPIVVPVGVGGPIVIVVGELEVDVVPSSGESSDALP